MDVSTDKDVSITVPTNPTSKDEEIVVQNPTDKDNTTSIILDSKELINQVSTENQNYIEATNQAGIENKNSTVSDPPVAKYQADTDIIKPITVSNSQVAKKEVINQIGLEDQNSAVSDKPEMIKQANLEYQNSVEAIKQSGIEDQSSDISDPPDVIKHTSFEDENPVVSQSPELIKQAGLEDQTSAVSDLPEVIKHTDIEDQCSAVSDPSEVIKQADIEDQCSLSSHPSEVNKHTDIEDQTSAVSDPPEVGTNNFIVPKSEEMIKEKLDTHKPDVTVNGLSDVHVEKDKVIYDTSEEYNIQSNIKPDLPEAPVVEYTHLLDSVTIGSDVEGDQETSNDLKALMGRMDEYEKRMKRQDHEINILKEQVKEKDNEIEKYQTRNRDVTFLKSRLKDDDTDIRNMKHELKRNRTILGDLQASVKQINHGIKSIGNTSVELEDRLSDIENLSPKMGVFEWRLDCYDYRSQNSEFLCSPEFYTHLNGFCCYLSVQWFGNKNGRMGVYLHLDKKKNYHLVENCNINMCIQCIGPYGLTKEHVVNYSDQAESEVSENDDMDDSMISGDDYFLLKPFLDKYLVDDCLYFYCHLIPDSEDDD